MKKILIAFLGKQEYKETTYQIREKTYKSQLAFIPVYKHFSPIDTIYIIGTRESRWEMLKDFAYTPVKIPYGKSESDFWEIFDRLTEHINLREAEVIFDVTHCFRAIPIFTAIYIRFIKYIEPTAIFSHIFYGSFEPGQPITPIVDLAPILELLDWIDATTSFTRYGELEELSQKIKSASDKAWKIGSPEKPKKLGDFSRRLEKLSNLSRLTYVPLLSGVSKEISTILVEEEFKREIKAYAKPFSLLSENLIKYSSRFIRPSMWESHLEAAKFYIESKRPTQALLVLREVILTYRCEKTDCDVYDLSSRNKIETELNEQRQQSKNPIVKLWQKITDARNRAGHALMKRTNKDLSPTKAIKEVKSLIDETEEILKDKK